MLIAFEGVDGSGKATQVELLADKLTSMCDADGMSTHSVFQFSFPEYQKNFFGNKVKKYLNGAYGSLLRNHPFMTSLLYSLDRFESRDQLWLAVNYGNSIVLCDRYVTSNVGHQAGKLMALGGEWLQLIKDIETVEYEILGLPMPDLVIYLDLTPAQSYARTHGRDAKTDLHQGDLQHLEYTQRVYRHCVATRASWHLVPCFTADDNRERTPEEIHAEILALVQSKINLEAGTTEAASVVAWG